MTLLNIAYTPKYDLNPISLGQLQELDILYFNHPNSTILRQKKSILGVANKKKNLFVLETSLIEKAMLVQGKSQPT